jgi:hypothetical protein
VQVAGKPAVDEGGRRKKDTQVLHSALPYHFSEFSSFVPCLALGLGLISDVARPPARPLGRCRRRRSGIDSALRARERVSATPRHTRRRAHRGGWPRAPSGASGSRAGARGRARPCAALPLQVRAAPTVRARARSAPVPTRSRLRARRPRHTSRPRRSPAPLVPLYAFFLACS